MSKQKSDVGLPLSIVFASLVIGGSLVFFATQANGGMSDEELAKKINEGIDQYVQNVQQEYQNTANPPQPQGNGDARDLVDDDAVMGDEDAPVTIVEFSDYQCPYCSRFFGETLPLIKENYIDTGKVKFVYRDFPLEGHPEALPAAFAAECARDQEGDEAYFAMHDMIFSGSSLGAAVYEGYAEEIGVDMDEYRECVSSGKFNDEVYADLNAGSSVGITGTPGFYINDQMLEGALPYSQFEAIIEAELAEG